MGILKTIVSATIIDFDKVWWGISKSIMQIIDWIGQAFNFIVGESRVSEEGGKISTVNNIFESLFSNPEAKINTTYWIIALGCIILMGAFIAIGAIKAQFTDDVPKSLGKMSGKAFVGVVKIVCLPLVFWLALIAVGVIFNFFISAMSVGSPGTSIAQQICDACNQTGKSIPFNTAYDASKMSTDKGSFQYLLCILSGSFLIVTLTTCCISLTKRFIEVFFYYLVAPVAIARVPIDDGKSFDLWKENTVAKLLGAAGIIIAMYLYYKIMPAFIDAVKQSGLFVIPGQGADSINVVGNIIIIMFLIGGSAVPASASMMFAQLISQGAGQNEANNMMHTQQMMGNAFRMATAIGGKTIAGALMAGGGGIAAGAASAGAAASGLMSGVGGAGAAAGATAGSLAMTGRALGGSAKLKDLAAPTSEATPSESAPMSGDLTVPDGATDKAMAAPIGALSEGKGLAGEIADTAPEATANTALVLSGNDSMPDGEQENASPFAVGIKTPRSMRQIWNKDKAKRKTLGKNQNLAALGFGGMIGIGSRRMISFARAVVSNPFRALGSKINASFGNTKKGIHRRQSAADSTYKNQLKFEAKKAEVQLKSLDTIDKKWNADIGSGGGVAEKRINKEVDDLQSRVADFDNKYAHIKKANPDLYSAYRQQSFGNEYSKVKRRLDSLKDNKNLGTSVEKGLERLDKISDGTYGDNNKEGDKN